MHCYPFVLGIEKCTVQFYLQNTFWVKAKCLMKYCGPQVREAMVTDFFPKGRSVLVCILVCLFVFVCLFVRSSICSFFALFLLWLLSVLHCRSEDARV